jgi:hypothetical protein
MIELHFLPPRTATNKLVQLLGRFFHGRNLRLIRPSNLPHLPAPREAFRFRSAVAILPPELTEKNLRILASEVIPKVRHLGVTPATVAAE